MLAPAAEAHRVRRSRRRRLLAAQVAGIAAGFAADLLLGDPKRFHPVAGFGRAATWLERRTYAPTVAAGARYAAIAAGVPVASAAAATIATRHRPVLRFALTAAATWTALGGTSLRREAYAMATELTEEDLSHARARLPSLCGRDPDGLGQPELARATVESIAENTSDAEVAPLFWGAVVGLPGLVGYRVVNTLDAMVGHRSPRYQRFGMAAARLDDAANLIPSRLTAALTAATAPVTGTSGLGALRTWLRDGGKHPSPNAGPCEAAMAGALGVRLGGRNVYRGRIEDRPVMGSSGRRPEVSDIGRAARVSYMVSLAALGFCVTVRILARRAS
jgi:adenosylcobinamide-phosphate synthase